MFRWPRTQWKRLRASTRRVQRPDAVARRNARRDRLHRVLVHRLPGRRPLERLWMHLALGAADTQAPNPDRGAARRHLAWSAPRTPHRPLAQMAALLLAQGLPLLLHQLARNPPPRFHARFLGSRQTVHQRRRCLERRPGVLRTVRSLAIPLAGVTIGHGCLLFVLESGPLVGPLRCHPAPEVQQSAGHPPDLPPYVAAVALHPGSMTGMLRRCCGCGASRDAPASAEPGATRVRPGHATCGCYDSERVPDHRRLRVQGADERYFEDGSVLASVTSWPYRCGRYQTGPKRRRPRAGTRGRSAAVWWP